MIITDSLYGSFEVNEQLINELIFSREFQRLKDISQFGIPPKYYHIKGDFSRYEHSVGVMLLLRKFNAGLEEQVAGLLHDVSHTAFSHIGDWVFGTNAEENYQDLNHESFLTNSDLPSILSKHSLDYTLISDISTFRLLERQRPELCADRLDFSLREIFYRFDKYFHELVLENLAVFDSNFAFKSKDKAREFAEYYLKLQTEHWGEIETLIRYHIFSDIIKYAIDDRIIDYKDLYLDDTTVINKLLNSDDHYVKEKLNILSSELKFEENSNNPDFILKEKKFRYVDPLYLENGNLSRLSENDLSYKKLLEEKMRLTKKSLRIKLLNNV
ncbi:MAG: HD domain-containing protein [Nanoarchaeota archaeon]